MASSKSSSSKTVTGEDRGDTMDNPHLRGKNNLTIDDNQTLKGLDPSSPPGGGSGGSSRVSREYQSLPSICESCKAFGHATEKCKAKKPVEDSEGWIRVGKGKGKAPETHGGGQFPSTSCLQPEEGSLHQPMVAVGTESQVGEAFKGGVEGPVEKEGIDNLEEVAAKGVLVEEENQTAEHRQSAVPLDSEEEDFQLEGGGRVFASPKLEATKPNIASNRADEAEEVESRTPNHSDVLLPHKVRWKVGKGRNETDDPQVSPALFPGLDCGGSDFLKKEAISVGDGVQAAAIKEISSQARQVFAEMPRSMPTDPGASVDARAEDEENRAQGIFKLAEAQGEVKPLPQ
ncbi:hypothetical protein U1Q18_009812, partial [Sarracenia purpurea var. burkii]